MKVNLKIDWNILKSVVGFLPYVAIVAIIVLPWVLNAGGIFLTDFVWGPHSTLFGHTFGLPWDVLEKIYIILAFAAVLFGGRTIARAFTKNEVITFLVAAFCLFNPFVYDRLMYGQLGIILALGLFLASFGYAIWYWREEKIKHLIFSAIFAGLCVANSLHFIFFLVVTYLTVFILLLVKNWADKKKIWKLTGFFAAAAVLVAIINWQFIYNTFLGKDATQQAQFQSFITQGITEQDFVLFETRGGSAIGVIKNLVAMTGFWGSEQFRYIPLQGAKGLWGIPFYILMLPLLITGIVVGLKNKKYRTLVIGSGVLYLVAFILAAGIALPGAEQISMWMYKHVPYYTGLREPEKWVAVIVGIYAMWMAIALKRMFKVDVVQQYRKIAIPVLVMVILAQAPLMVFGAVGQAPVIQYPNDWYAVNQQLVNDTSGCKQNILFLPWHLYMNFQWMGRAIVSNPAPVFFDCPVYSGTNMEAGGIFDNSTNPTSKLIEDWISAQGKTELLTNNTLNIGYVLLTKEVDYTNYAWLFDDANLETIEQSDNFLIFKVK